MCFTLVIYQETLRDARSIKYKILPNGIVSASNFMHFFHV